jgi:hypothetical protein
MHEFIKYPLHMFKPIAGTVITLLICHVCVAQIQLTRLTKQSLPPGIRYTGKIQEAVTWNDKLGLNYVITTETGEMPDGKNEGYRKGALYAYHYGTSGDSLRQTWRVYDYVDECPFDLRASFLKKTFSVTDLDKNGIAEVWLMYHVFCRSDVSPAQMRVIMYEGGKKHAMRGQNRVQYSETGFTGGNYTFDAAFEKAAPEFRKYAQALWKNNLIEKPGY